jgi:hypothetical protein
LKDIGKNKVGATPGEVNSKVTDSFQKNINGTVKHLNLDQIKEVVGSIVSEVKDMLEKGTDEPRIWLKIARSWSKKIRLAMLLKNPWKLI